jgi:two-component system LytT family sensor kinase
MGRGDIKVFFHLLIGWMVFIFLLMTPEIIVIAPSYLVSKTFFVQYGLFGLINFIIFCLASFIITPKYFQQKKYWKFTLACIGTIVACAIFKYLVARMFGDIVLGQYRQTGKPEHIIALAFMFITIRNTFCSLFIGVAHRSFIDWVITEKKKRELETQKIASEMAFLKMQVNPHFLFNTLNNLYSLAVLERTFRTADGIIKLSNLFRYMLYEKEDSNNRVALQKEIDMINSFIDLQKLRYDGGFYVHFSIEGEVAQLKIAPLILFPLIENAFKHGIIDVPDKPVTMNLVIDGKNLLFSVKDSINSYLKDKTGGIGLENVRKRLAILYPGTHTMEIQQTAESFLVQLQLPL